MKAKLLRYFELCNEEDLNRSVELNEYKHLSNEYRENYEKMESILHSEFYELGKSGKEYSKHSILQHMPLNTIKCTISSFSYYIYKESLVCNYILQEGERLMKCKTIWMFEDENLKLRLFESNYIDE